MTMNALEMVYAQCFGSSNTDCMLDQIMSLLDSSKSHMYTYFLKTDFQFPEIESAASIFQTCLAQTKNMALQTLERCKDEPLAKEYLLEKQLTFEKDIFGQCERLSLNEYMGDCATQTQVELGASILPQTDSLSRILPKGWNTTYLMVGTTVSFLAIGLLYRYCKKKK